MIQDEQLQKHEKTKDLNSLELEEAVKIEHESYLKIKEANLQLDKALAIQEQTLSELKQQGECITQVKNTAIKILENSKASCETQFKIKEESKILPNFGNVINKVKRWWNKDRKMENEVLEIKERMNKEGSISPKETKMSSFSDKIIGEEDDSMGYDSSNIKNESSPLIADSTILKDEQIFLEEKKTDDELSKIFETLKKINKETKAQIGIIKEQKNDIKDIARLGEFSSKIVDETEKQMHKGKK